MTRLSRVANLTAGVNCNQLWSHGLFYLVLDAHLPVIGAISLMETDWSKEASIAHRMMIVGSSELLQWIFWNNSCIWLIEYCDCILRYYDQIYIYIFIYLFIQYILKSILAHRIVSISSSNKYLRISVIVFNFMVLQSYFKMNLFTTHLHIVNITLWFIIYLKRLSKYHT